MRCLGVEGAKDQFATRFDQLVKAVQADDGFRVRRSQRVTTNFRRLTEQRLGRRQITVRPEQPAKTAQVGRVIGMILAECLAPHLKGLVQQRFRLQRLALHDVEQRQLIKSGGEFGMTRAVGLANQLDPTVRVENRIAFVPAIG